MMMLYVVTGTRQATNTEKMIFWVVFVLVVGFLTVFIAKRVRDNKKSRIAKEIEIEDFKNKYNNLTSELFDECPDDQLYDAIAAQCERKDDEDEHYIDTMNEAEQTVYSIYLLNQSISATSGIRSFFQSPSTEPFVPIIDDIFRRIGCNDIAELMAAARKLYNVLANGEEDDDDSDYSRYNFSDFSHEYVTMIVGTNFTKKITDYIKEHKDDFITKEEASDEDTVSE